MSRRTLYRRILLPLAAVTPHFLASTSDMPSPPLVTEKQQFLELSTSPIHPLGGNRVLTSFVRFGEGLEFGESRFLRSSVGSGRELVTQKQEERRIRNSSRTSHVFGFSMCLFHLYALYNLKSLRSKGRRGGCKRRFD
ncbi:hypothetical protein HID58_057079 [Brassica napus]|uniref:Secreted protein n=1 Tax=Brassica napus TaxID=3708 RepID=A0ABQ8AQ49_BRANA|nr:hypothetical protein HID58_057079 [Brassica napus]